jgi:hypothetical protein
MQISKSRVWKTKSLFFWLAIIGLATHIVFLFSIGTLAEVHAQRVSDRIRNDPYYTPGYEDWEPDWVQTVITIAMPLFVYFPAIVSAIIMRALSEVLHRGVGLKESLGVCVGVFTVLYAILETFNT